MSKSIKKKVISSMIYRYIELFFSFGVRFVITIILSRLLSPHAFGVIALTNIFIDISLVLITNGLDNALIQKKGADERDFASVFIFGIAVALILYLIIFIIAPLVSKFYNEEELTNILRVLGLTLIISSYQNSLNAKLKKNLNFKTMSISSVIASVSSGIIGIVMAYFGLGVWALVGQRISKTILYVIFISVKSKWHPTFYFSYKRIKPLWNFSWKIFAENVTNKIVVNLRGLFIGKVYTSEILAFFNKGQSLPNNFITVADGSIQSVLFPAMSIYQDDIKKVKAVAKRSIKVSSYFVIPIMVGFMAISVPFVKVLLTEKWLPSVPYIRIFCLAYILRPALTTNLQIAKALGRSDITLITSVVRNVLEIIAIALTIRLGVIYLAITVPILAVVSFFINGYPSTKFIKYNYIEQILDIFPIIIASSIMGGLVYLISYIEISNVLILAFQIILGIIIYLIISILFKIDSYNYILDLIKTFFKKKREEKNNK